MSQNPMENQIDPNRQMSPPSISSPTPEHQPHAKLIVLAVVLVVTVIAGVFITQNKMEIALLYDGNESFPKDTFYEKKDQLASLITAAKRASQENAIDPMEKAICHVCSNMSYETEAGLTLIKAYPLSTDLLSMTNVLKNRPSRPEPARYQMAAATETFSCSPRPF